MAIRINHSSDRVDPPAVTLTGQLIDTTAGTYSASASVAVSTQHISLVGATEVNHRAEKAFQGNVTVVLTPDPTWIANNYCNRTSTEAVGATVPAIDKIGAYAETYYTLNGKDPIRTKAHLYKGAFTVRRNESGSDNFILKARTYCRGKWSEVRTVEFRIARANANRV
jgi:hypothetical protein